MTADDLPAALAAHLRAAAARPFARPADDCCAMALDWILARTGVDPAADIRAAYRDLRGAAGIIRAEGGFVPMWRVRMAAVGFTETHAPRLGDVAVVVDAGRQMVAAIRTAEGWAAKARSGLVIGPFPPLAAWNLARG